MKQADLIGRLRDINDWMTLRLLSTAVWLVEHARTEKLADPGLTHAGSCRILRLWRPTRLCPGRANVSITACSRQKGMALILLDLS